MKINNMDSFVRTKYGTLIRKCCATCIHKNVHGEFTRLCDAGEGIVRPKHICANWEMQPKFDNAGKADGRIKKRRYLYFVQEYQQPKKGPLVPATQIRKEYEEEYGTVFLDF